MTEIFEELPKDKGFPTADDVKRWREIFDKSSLGGNTSQLVGFKFVDGEVMAITEYKAGRN